MTDAKPLARRDRVAPRPPARRPRPRTRESAPVRFEVERAGEHVAGLARGIDRAHLRRLRAGEVPVDDRVDLHGLRSDAARAAVRQAFERVAAGGGRCLVVVHGRGRHSADGPVLKEALVEWLCEPPLASRVMAFASATPRDGGPGATTVLLRRQAEGS